MKRIFSRVNEASTYMHWISGLTLAGLLFLTVIDVVMRTVYRPIPGVYDLTALAGGLIVAFALPNSIAERVHVYIDFFIDRASPRWKNVLAIVAYPLTIFFFFLVGWRLIAYGVNLYKVEEVSATIRVPLYPFAIVIGVLCFMGCLVLLGQLIEKIGEGGRS
jgi:TRAP-type C4-dicarboxylate transport system permease small subunit